MSSEGVMIQVEGEELLADNYALLPYIKVEEDSLKVLHGDGFKDSSAEAVLCVPVADALFDYNIETSFIEQHSEDDFLNEHNYNNSNGDEKSLLNMYWETPSKKERSGWECSDCHKVMKTPGGFYRHLRIHTGEKPFQCQLCEKKFSQQSNLWKHVLIHTGERRFECPQCNKKFSQRANMQKHMMVHTGEKPFTCYVCSRTFTQRANLNKHIRIHTGEKPYSCKYCNRQFAQQSNMQKHELIHEGVRPFACTLCPAAFTQQSNLKKHLEVHADVKQEAAAQAQAQAPAFSCGTCFKSYKTWESLRRHVKACPRRAGASDILIELDDRADDEDTIFLNVDSANKQCFVVKDQELWLQNVNLCKK